MKAGIKIFGWLLIVEFGAACFIPEALCQVEPRTRTTAKVLVWVRDGRGAPVPGLTANDFVVTENGLRDRIIAVESFFSDAPVIANPIRENKDSVAGGADAGDKSWLSLTHVLIVIPQMSAAGRHNAISDALRFLSQPGAEKWEIALVDDAGNYVPYSQSVESMRAILKHLQRRISPHPEGWYWRTTRAIQELGIQPGRHVIVLFSDNREVRPSAFIEPAVLAQAALYTVNTVGPKPIVPFYSAASEEQSSEFGAVPMVHGENADLVLSSALAMLGNLDNGMGDFLRAAEETDGLTVDDLKDAFHHIAADSAGYYLVGFEAKPDERDGTWHPFMISVRPSHLKVKAPRYYMVPFETSAGEIPPEMKEVMSSPANKSPELKQPNGPTGMSVDANAWLFPDQGGVHMGAFATEVEWKEGAPAPESRVKIYAELINESAHGVAGSWYEERDWEAGHGRSSVHWQREAHLYPGTYLLRVAAMDTATGKVAIGMHAFVARPLDSFSGAQSFRFSSVVLADKCLSASEQTVMRRNVLDPMLWNECKLAPSASSRFSADQNPMILLRLYPPNTKTARFVIDTWKAYAFVDDADDKATELNITAAGVRGLVAEGRLSLNMLGLRPGKHQLTVLFVVPGNSSRKNTIALRTEFSTEP